MRANGVGHNNNVTMQVGRDNSATDARLQYVDNYHYLLSTSLACSRVSDIKVLVHLESEKYFELYANFYSWS